MLSKYKYNDITWIDLESPTTEEIFDLVDEFSIPPLVAEEFISKTVRSKVDVYRNLIYLILHFPVKYENGNDSTEEQEIDFVVGKNFLITIHYELKNPLHEFFKKFEAHSLVDKNSMGDHAGYLFYHILKELYKNVMIDLEKMHPEMKSIEKGIFSGKEKQTVKTISSVNQKILDIRQAMRFHSQTLTSFESAGKKFFGAEFNYYLEEIIGEYNKIETVLENYKDLLTDLRETNDSLLSYKTNETIKFLTIMNFIMLPLTLITGVFGMNMKDVLLQTKNDFYLVIGAMTLTGIVMLIYFKIKKWL
ncbi:MAG: magnesium transporter CorA family protein [Patescibacteria group bacterium]